ncbi:hypothetical protein [Vibrio profundi]|uniref:hypothetical protein n=1 Tax=Vibrio profundi TaxID=1774960 RepID=UPI003734EC0B
MGVSAQAGNQSLGLTVTSNMEDIVVAGEYGIHTALDAEMTMSIVAYNSRDVRGVAEGPVAVFSGGPFVGIGLEGVYVQSLNSEVWGMGVSAGFLGLPGVDMAIVTGKIVKQYSSKKELNKIIALFSDPKAETCGLDISWEFLRGLRIQIPEWNNRIIEVPSKYYRKNSSQIYTPPACSYTTISPGWIKWMKTDPELKDIFNTNDRIIYLDVLARESWCSSYNTKQNDPRNEAHCHGIWDIHPMSWPPSYGFIQANALGHRLYMGANPPTPLSSNWIQGNAWSQAER